MAPNAGTPDDSERESGSPDVTELSEEAVTAAKRLDPTGQAAGLANGPVPLIFLAAGIIVVLGLREFSTQLGPLVLAVILTTAVSPIRGWLAGRGWPNWAALLGTMSVAVLGLLAFVLALVWSGWAIVDLFTSPEYADGLTDLQDDVGTWLEDLGVRPGAVNDAVNNLDFQSVLGQLGNALSGVVGVASAVGLVVIAMFFMIGDAQPFHDRLNELSVTRPYLTGGLNNFAVRTRSYLWVSTVFGAIVAILDGVALWLLDIPLVMVWVVLSFITNYIPNVGFVIGVIPPALVALVAFDVNKAIWVVVIYVVLNFVIQTLIQPRIVGDNVGLSTTLTFLSLVFWSWVIGPLGAILAVPLTLLAKALLIDTNPGTQWVRPLLSLRPVADTESVVPPAAAASDADGDV